MLVVALLGAMIVRQTPMMSSDTTAISAFGHPRTMEDSQAQAVADNLVLAHHEMQSECVEQTTQVVRDPRTNPTQNAGTGTTAFPIAIGQTSTMVGTAAGARSWPAQGPINTTCGGLTAFSMTNVGSSGTLVTDGTTDTTDERTRIPMLNTAGGPLGKILMVRSGMYLITTWTPPVGSSLAYRTQICTLAAAYLRNRLSGADWVGSYDAAKGTVRIWTGVGAVPDSAGRTSSLDVPVAATAQASLTNGCPAYVEPIHN